MRFVEEWHAYTGGTLFGMVVVEQAETDDPLLLRQYGADHLLTDLARLDPDPQDWVRVSRSEGGRCRLVDAGESIEEIEDAM